MTGGAGEVTRLLCRAGRARTHAEASAKRRETSSQLTTFHQASMYEGRLFWYLM